MRCLSVVIAFMMFACSSSDPAPATDPPDSAVAPDVTPDAGNPDDPDRDTPYSIAVSADTPLLYWRLNEKKGVTTARDRTSNKLDGTFSAEDIEHDQPSLVGDTNTSVRVTPGGSIDGPKDAKLSFVGNAAFTLECWISVPAPPVEIHTILSLASEAKASGYSLWLDPADGLRAYFGRYEAGVGATASTPAATPLVAGTAYHIVAVYDGAQLSISLDGVSGDPKPSAAALTDGGYRLRVGHSEDTTPKLSARVDELAVYPRALPNDRIKAHLDIGKAGN